MCNSNKRNCEFDCNKVQMYIKIYTNYRYLRFKFNSAIKILEKNEKLQQYISSEI